MVRALAWHARGRWFKSTRLHHVGAKFALFRLIFCLWQKISYPPAPLLLLFQNRSCSLRLFACKRAHDASGSLPTCFGARSSIPTGETLKISFSCGSHMSEWTTLHSKSPAEWLGISYTAPSFLLLAKSHAYCGYVLVNADITLLLRYQLFASRGGV